MVLLRPRFASLASCPDTEEGPAAVFVLKYLDLRQGAHTLERPHAQHSLVWSVYV